MSFSALVPFLGILNISNASGNAGAKFVRLRAHLFVRELLHLRLQGVDGLDHRQHALHGALVAGTENFC